MLEGDLLVNTSERVQPVSRRGVRGATGAERVSRVRCWILVWDGVHGVLGVFIRDLLAGTCERVLQLPGRDIFADASHYMRPVQRGHLRACAKRGVLSVPARGVLAVGGERVQPVSCWAVFRGSRGLRVHRVCTGSVERGRGLHMHPLRDGKVQGNDRGHDDWGVRGLP